MAEERLFYMSNSIVNEDFTIHKMCLLVLNQSIRAPQRNSVLLAIDGELSTK